MLTPAAHRAVLANTGQRSDLTGAKRFGGELAVFVPKIMCVRSALRQHGRATPPCVAGSDYAGRNCVSQGRSPMHGYDADTESRGIDLLMAQSMCSSDRTDFRSAVTKALVRPHKCNFDEHALCKPYELPATQRLITDYFQFVDLATVDISTASTDELTWIHFMRWATFTGGWIDWTVSRAMRVRAQQLRMGIWAQKRALDTHILQ